MACKSDDEFRSLVENAGIAIAITNLKGHFTYVNKALADLLGYSVQELLGRPFKEFLHPDEKAKIVRAFLKIILLRRQPRSLEFRVINKDGHVIHLWSKPSRFMVNGKTIGFQAIMVDLTELKKMERQLRDANRKLQMLFETMMEGITIVDENERITFANKAFADMLGYKKEELIGTELRKLVTMEGFEEIKRQTEKRMRGEISRYELTLCRKNGEPCIAQISASPIQNEEGIFEGTLAVIIDITERKRIEEKLAESEERLRRFIENAPEAIYVSDLNGNFIDGNKQAERLIGYKRKEIIGKNMLQIGILSENYLPKVIGALEKNMQGEKTGPDEFELIRKDGSKVCVEISTIPIKSGGKIEVLGIARDITERNQMQRKLEEYSEHLETLVKQRTRQLEEAQEQLLRSERLAAIGQVAAMVGHDLRNPLTGIKGAVYYLKTKLDSAMDEKVKEMLALIEKEIYYANRIITDLLEYSKEIHLELTETTPKVIMKEILSLLEAPKNIQLIDLTETQPKIKVDIEKMARVFNNIIKNAIDAMPNGGKLVIKSSQSNGFVTFTFADAGIGMPPEVMQKIWTPFFTTKSKGMGLGLPICKRIVEAHGGNISVESKVGEGTTFVVTMPVDPEQEEGGEKVWVNVQESLLSTMTKA